MLRALGRIDGGIIVLRRLGLKGVICNLVDWGSEDIFTIAGPENKRSCIDVAALRKLLEEGKFW